MQNHHEKWKIKLPTLPRYHGKVKKKNLLKPMYLLHAKNLTISWWNSYLPDNFLTKFKFWVGDFIVVLSILCLFGFPEQIFIEMKGGKNMSEGIIEAKHCQIGCHKVFFFFIFYFYLFFLLLLLL